MRKIQKTLINSTYQAINGAALVPGFMIPFDCYIKRFNNYVIIIKAGTVISKALSEQIQTKQLFIANDDRQKYDTYKKEGKDISSLTEKFSSITQLDADVKEKIFKIYSLINQYMNDYFSKESHELNMSIINHYTDAILAIILNSNYELKDFSVSLATVYSESSHSVNVSILSALFAKANGFDYDMIRDIVIAGLLHDCGKRSMDKKILDKNSSLTDEEFALMKEHPVRGVEEAKHIGVTKQTILEAIGGHHEKLDGSGYPEGVFSARISEASQIIAICDTFDALTTQRTFRDKFSSFDSLLMMKNEMSEQLNKSYIAKFIKMFR
ncbi:MAG: HD domain-containing protein [Thiovulaceae bacterium]|nr:HD domain-containing protein [Sulfurimonadaceae bacterium]